MAASRQTAGVAPFRWMWILLIATVAIAACIESGGIAGPPTTVAEVTVTAPRTTIEVGETVQLSATAHNSDGDTLSGKQFTWSSAAEAGATVDPSTGLVTGVSPGPVRIDAVETETGEVGSLTIVVEAAAVHSVTVSPSDLALREGGTARLEVVLRDARDEVLTDRDVEWTSSNEAVATVDGNGLVTAVAGGGPVTITATAEGQSASATVTVEMSECTDMASRTVGTVTLPDTVSASLGTGGCVWAGKYYHVWTLGVAADNPAGSGTIQINLESPAFRPFLQIRSAASVAGVSSKHEHDFGTYTPSIITVPAGTYHLFVTSDLPGESGAYTLAVVPPEVPPECRPLSRYPAGFASIGGTVGGALGGSYSCYNTRDERWYQAWVLEVNGDMIAQIDASSTEFDPALVVFGYGLDDDSGPGTDAQLTLSLRADYHTVFVTSAETDQLGAYSLTVQRLGEYPYCWGAMPDDVVGSIGVVDTVVGALETTDCQWGGRGRYSDVWTLDVTADTTIRIELASNEFDTFLMLYGESTLLIAADDDGAGGPSSVLEHTFARGRYYIRVTSYDPGERGAYLLSTQGRPAGSARETSDAPPPTAAASAAVRAAKSTAAEASAEGTRDAGIPRPPR